MFVFWFLVLVLAAVLALILAHLFGVRLYETTEKIYKSFTEEDDELKGKERDE